MASWKALILGTPVLAGIKEIRLENWGVERYENSGIGCRSLLLSSSGSLQEVTRERAVVPSDLVVVLEELLLLLCQKDRSAERNHESLEDAVNRRRAPALAAADAIDFFRSNDMVLPLFLRCLFLAWFFSVVEQLLYSSAKLSQRLI